MSNQALQNLSIIVGMLIGALGLYYLARTSVRDNARQRVAEIDKARADAVAPVQRDLDAANRKIDRLTTQLEDRDRRIDSLEDELRRGRGYGGSRE